MIQIDLLTQRSSSNATTRAASKNDGWVVMTGLSLNF